MSIKEKVKTQIGYMKKGAKILPKVIAQKSREYAERKVRDIIKEQKRKALLNEQLKYETDKIRRDAYEEELRKIAKIEGQNAARKKGTAQGLGLRAQIGAAGQRMNVGDLLGFRPIGQQQPTGQKKKKKK